MKQIVQYLNTGETKLVELSAPTLQPGCILIQTSCSLISSGTEKMLIEFGKSNLISKARKNPERVAQVLDKIKTEGLLPTLEAVFKKLDEPLPMGYCNVGIVIAIANDVHEFSVGDRVASNGNHAEFVCVPKNLVAKIPDSVSDEEAVFTIIAAIGLQSIRLANPQLGETLVIFGLGLVGFLTSQLLISNGCNVIAFDIDQSKIDLAASLGIDAFNSTQVDVLQIINAKTNFVGSDAVIITASAHNDQLINTAAKISRKKGKIILVGVADMKLDRNEFYKKELQFHVSCSYGPGRYDTTYEEDGIDYPIAYVRWTEQRNFETILQCMENKRLNVLPLISKNYPFSEAETAYLNLTKENSIATILKYSHNAKYSQLFSVSKYINPSGKNIVGIIGAGNFSKMTLLPALKKASASIKYISGNSGLHATELAKKYNIPNATTDNANIFNDPDVTLIIIATRHDSHAALILEAIRNKKHVFTEKPIALTMDQLDSIQNALQESPNLLFFAGFNRRHAPLAIKAKTLLQSHNDLNIVITVNAGSLAPDHWLYHEHKGGGRIVGEACHYFDLMSFFANSEIETVYATDSGKSNHLENTIIHLKYKNGVHGVINYFSNGNRAYSKEKIEIYSGQRILIIDNFKKMTGFGFKNFNTESTRQNKGHYEQFENILYLLKHGGEQFTSLNSLINTSKATFAAVTSIKEQKIITL